MSARRYPIFSFNRIGQIIFTFREVTKIAVKVNLKVFIAIFVLNAIAGFLVIPGLYIEKLILDALVANISNPNVSAAVYAIGLLLALRITYETFRLLLNRLIFYLRRNFALQFEVELDTLMAQKLSELDIVTIEDAKFKDKFTRILRESGRHAYGIMSPIADIPHEIVGFISSVVVLLFLHPLIAIGLLIVSVPQFLVDSRLIKQEYELVARLSPIRKQVGWLSYYLLRNNNFLELKLLNLQDYLVWKLRSLQKHIIGAQLAMRKKREVSHVATSFLFSIFEFLVSIWLVFLVVIARITVGSAQLYLRTLASAQTNLSNLVSSLLELYENYIYVTDLVWFLNLSPLIPQKTKHGYKLISDKYSVEFRNVWFRYKAGQPWIIKGVSFTISPSENVALVGLNGAGKSTLIKLLARFYDPQKGEIIVNGKNLKDINIGQWRDELAILFQEFEKYPFSVNESVGFGDVERIHETDEIKKAVEATGMDAFVENLPLKYENPLDPEFEKGIRPSIGQQQRFGISRMLFRKFANVVVMDEPTSNVDPEAEEKIFNELVRIARNKILIFVTQRFSTVRLADRILVLDQGKIVEEGKHEQLLKQNGKYAKLFKLQAKGYK